MDGNLTKSGLRIVAEAAVVLAEVAEGEAGEMPFVGRVAEGAKVRVMRSFDADATAFADQSVELFHGFDDVGDVLDDVDCADLIERACSEGVGEAVEVADDVRITRKIPVDADRSGVLTNAAADVENLQLSMLTRDGSNGLRNFRGVPGPPPEKRRR